MSKLLGYLVLPREVTPFEDRYLRRTNKIALGFFWLHPPVFVIVALLAGTSKLLAAGLSLAAMVGPMIGYFTFRDRPRIVSMIFGFTAMLMGGALVYVGQGPMQIEMHFYFFVLIALLAVFGNPLVILTAAVTVAAHHLVVFLVIPRGVFNYDASIWAVVVHAVFVVIESVAAVFVARSFFDNVIGLEQIVDARTKALDARRRDMALILDHVDQGLVTARLDGVLGGEWSGSLARWFGTPATGVKLWDYLPLGGASTVMRYGFEALVDAMMPPDVVIEQLPSAFRASDRDFRIAYQAINDPPTEVLVVLDSTIDPSASIAVDVRAKEATKSRR